MKNSIMLRRTVVLVFIALTISGCLSASLYIIVQQNLYIKSEATKMLSHCQFVAGFFNKDINPEDPQLAGLLGKNYPLGHVKIYDINGNELKSSQPIKNKYAPNNKQEPRTPGLSPQEVQRVLGGVQINEVRSVGDEPKHLVVAIPIEADDTIVGVVSLTQSVEDVYANLKSLNITLLLSTLASFLIMLVPCYLAARHITVPIRKMESVARGMAKGDFSIRADENQKGEIGELAKSINHFAAESEILEQTRKDYVANISHELRTPISAIRAMGETLKDGMIKDSEKQDKYYNNIVNESMRLSRLVDDLLELSNLQSGKTALEKRYFDIHDIIESVRETYSPIASEAGITFEASANDSVQVYSNSDRIEQILVILLDNAIKYTPEGGTVTLIAEEKDTHVDVHVKDNGIGIPEEDVKFIFSRFYKVDKAHAEEGTGLGLSIASELIHKLGESIHVISSAGEGCEFIFTVSKK